MAVLLVLFNPCTSVRIVTNWLYVWNKLVAAGIPVFGVELVYPWQKPALADACKTITVRSDSIMFHKEKLIERLLREVPPTYTKICPIDCDVVFARPDWYDAVSIALDTYSVVQPYSECYWLGPDLKLSAGTLPSASSCLEATRTAHAAGHTERLSGCPGYAMAMRREIRPFTWGVVGSGDAIFFRGIAGLVGCFGSGQLKQMFDAVWDTWSASAKVPVSGVAGGIWHMWHGPMKARQYQDRYVKFMSVIPPDETDIRNLLVENADGVWEWREDMKRALNTVMLRYFAGRDDDSVSMS
jgi:hypothetical protein